jgi:hypothetical protein
LSLPQAVQAQIDEANRLQAAMSAPEAPEAQDPPVEVQAPEQLELPLETTPQPAVSEETWEARYRSNIGRYEAETKRAREAAQQAWQQIEQMRAELDQLKAQPTPEPAPEPETPGVTDQDVETFGSDLVDFAQRAARKAIADQQKVIDAKIQGLFNALDEIRGSVGKVEQTTQQTAAQSYLKDLTRRVPNWEQINIDQAFIDWLQEPEGLSNIPRQQFLLQAHQSLDVDTVVKYFDAFAAPSSAPAAPATKPSQSAELQKQVSPPRAKAGSTAPAQQDQKTWTEADIMKFYEQKARGQIDAPTAARMEADLNQAVAEGRVR